MTIEIIEKVRLTDAEKELLHRARTLLNEIYDAASDDNICNATDAASDAINELLDYCQ